MERTNPFPNKNKTNKKNYQATACSWSGSKLTLSSGPTKSTTSPLIQESHLHSTTTRNLYTTWNIYMQYLTWNLYTKRSAGIERALGHRHDQDQPNSNWHGKEEVLTKYQWLKCKQCLLSLSLMNNIHHERGQAVRSWNMYEVRLKNYTTMLKKTTQLWQKMW